MGVATTLDLSGAQSGATSHVQFLWRAPLGAHLVLRGRGLWPLLGGSADDGLMEMRTWTFGVATDLQLTFADPAARVRPFVGATVGGHLILTEINSPAHSDNRSAFTPTATLGLQAGLGYRVTATIEVFVEVGAARDWLVPGVQRSGYEATIANATSLHSAIGAMFDY
jgi:hypothetical protein